jgi:hypothetical protein
MPKRFLQVGDTIAIHSGLFPVKYEKVVKVVGNVATTDGLRRLNTRVWYKGAVYLYNRKPQPSLPEFTLHDEKENPSPQT